MSFEAWVAAEAQEHVAESGMRQARWAGDDTRRLAKAGVKKTNKKRP